VKDYSIIKNRKTKQIPKRTSFSLQCKVWKTASFHDLPQNADSLNWLRKREPPTRKKWILHTMTNSYTYLHNGLSPSPSMPATDKTLNALAPPALCHEAWPTAHILPFPGEFCQKREFKNWKFENVVNLEIFNCSQ
jgi:hypothetical protein